MRASKQKACLKCRPGLLPGLDTPAERQNLVRRRSDKTRQIAGRQAALRRPWSVMHQISPKTPPPLTRLPLTSSPRPYPPCTRVAAVSCACYAFRSPCTWRGTSSSSMPALLSNLMSFPHLRLKPVRQQHRLNFEPHLLCCNLIT